MRAASTMGHVESALAERLISALFQVDRARSSGDLGAAKAALSRVLQETDRAGVPLAEVSRMSGLAPAELRQLLD